MGAALSHANADESGEAGIAMRFLGRESLIDEVAGCLGAAEPSPCDRRWTVVGAPGTGKTFIAHAILEKLKIRNPHWIYAWLVGSSRLELQEGLRALVCHIDPSAAEKTMAESLNQLRALFSQGDNAVLVIDDATVGTLDYLEQQVLPPGRGRVLMTSPVALSSSTSKLDPLEAETSAMAIRRILEQQFPGRPNAIHLTLEETSSDYLRCALSSAPVSNLPLMVDQVARLVAAHAKDFGAYENGDVNPVWGQCDYRFGICRRLIDMALEDIARPFRVPCQALDNESTCNMMGAVQAWVRRLRKLPDQALRNACLTVLHACSLLGGRGGVPWSLLHAFFVRQRHNMGNMQECRFGKHSNTRMGLKNSSPDHYHDSSIMAPLQWLLFFPPAAALNGNCGNKQVKFSYGGDKGLASSEAEDGVLLQRAVTALEGLVYILETGPDRAVFMHFTVEHCVRQLLGPSCPGLAQVLASGSSAQIAHAASSCDELRWLPSTVAYLKDRLNCAAHATELDIELMGRTGRALLDRGLSSDAEPYLVQAVQCQKLQPGPTSQSMLDNMSCLASCYCAKERYNEAEPLYNELLEHNAAQFGRKHRQTIASIHNLGVLYHRIGQNSQAELLLAEALSSMIDGIGKTDIDTLSCMEHLGLLYQDMDLVSEAEPLLQEALTSKRLQLGETHPDTLASIESLGDFYMQQGNVKKAVPLLEEALHARRAELGSNPDTVTRIHDLGIAYKMLGQDVKAEPLLAEALNSRMDQLGSSHPVTRSIMEKLAGVHERLGHLSKATVLRLELKEEEFREAENRARQYRENGQYEEAALLLAGMLEERRTIVMEEDEISSNDEDTPNNNENEDVIDLVSEEIQGQDFTDYVSEKIQGQDAVLPSQEVSVQSQMAMKKNKKKKNKKKKGFLKSFMFCISMDNRPADM